MKAQNAASDRGLHCLPPILQLLNRSAGSYMDLHQHLGVVWQTIKVFPIFCVNTVVLYKFNA